MKHKHFIAAATVISMLTLLCAGSASAASIKKSHASADTAPQYAVNVLTDHVIDAGTYTELDYEFAQKALTAKYDGWGGGCTAFATTTKDGKTITGRNLDFYITKNPAYVIRTKVPGDYETIGVCYSHSTGKSYEETLKNGIDENVKKLIPFLCTDVLNSEGLYVETNMRNGEFNKDHSHKYCCDGTNPEAEQRLCALVLPRYICQHCKNVPEAIEYVKTLDIYTPHSDTMGWNFCYMLADAEGNYGLLEIAKNKISYLDKQHGQTNFYVTEEFAKDEELKCGLGRYDLMMKGIDNVQSEMDMFNLIDQTTYYQAYDPDNCKYDYRTEYVGEHPEWTSDYVTDPAHAEEVRATAMNCKNKLAGMTRADIEANGTYWESVVTSITNCTDKTMTIRFFENNDRVVKLDFNK